jgi:hypothetical protein
VRRIELLVLGRCELSAGLKVLSFPGEDGETHRTLVAPNSVLGRIRRLADTLVKSYPWFEVDAAWFVLTGEVPCVAPMSWSVKSRSHVPALSDDSGDAAFTHTLITLTVEPWISADTVLAVYGDIQRYLLGKDNRPVGSKNLALFRFVTEKVGPASLSPGERRLLAPKLLTEWNRQHPKWTYGHDTRTFWRDYNSVRKSLINPRYY